MYGLIYPFVFIALGLVFVEVLGTTSIDFTMTRFKEMLPNVPTAEEIPVYFLVINLILAPFVNFIPAFGEEYGWRGFLLPKLIGRFDLLTG
ncbi:MAG: CPBP family intramembrane metalloprotease domain-containing protein, partial [Nitrososphaeria archaeon]|nr:CPBP family intramembrane metalloprotease domain-containing protein [Nitrososphaeria archaeon]